MSKSDFKIEDLSTWRHKDAAFVVMLGYACGWSIIPNNTGAVRMYSQDGTQVTVPDNQSLNINVFRSWLSKVWRHRRTSVSPAAFEAMINPAKLDRPHVKIAWGATGMEPPTPLPADDPRHDERVEVDETDWSTVDLRDDAAHREAADAVAALVDAAMHPEEAIEYEKPRLDKPAADYKDHGVTVRVEPNTYKKNKQSQLVVVAEHVLRRTWSDGYIDFACADCGHVSASPSGIGGHRVIHGPHATARGRKGAEARAAMKAEAEAERAQRKRDKDAERKRKDRERKRGQYVPAAQRGVSSTMPPPPPAGPENVLKQIMDLLYPDMVIRLIEMQALRDDAIVRAEKAEGDLDALRDLLGVKR